MWYYFDKSIRKTSGNYRKTPGKHQLTARKPKKFIRKIQGTMRNTQENVSEIYKKYIRNFWKDIREKYVINKKLTSKL